MKQRAFTIKVAEYDRLEDMHPDQADLVHKAMEAAEGAYAPYSSYQVGAAVRMQNGEIITGNNQENAAYPSGLCAERVAIFYAGSRLPEVAAMSLAIAAKSEGLFQEEPVTPCGACRQVIFEKEQQGNLPMEVILYGSKKIQVLRSATDLLPLPFIFLKQD